MRQRKRRAACLKRSAPCTAKKQPFRRKPRRNAAAVQGSLASTPSSRLRRRSSTPAAIRCFRCDRHAGALPPMPTEIGGEHNSPAIFRIPLTPLGGHGLHYIEVAFRLGYAPFRYSRSGSRGACRRTIVAGSQPGARCAQQAAAESSRERPGATSRLPLRNPDFS